MLQVKFKRGYGKNFAETDQISTDEAVLDSTRYGKVLLFIVQLIYTVRLIIKRPARDACLCMGELQAPPAPHFIILITL